MLSVGRRRRRTDRLRSEKRAEVDYVGRTVPHAAGVCVCVRAHTNSFVCVPHVVAKMFFTNVNALGVVGDA